MGTLVRIVGEGGGPVIPPEDGIEGLTEMQSRRDRLDQAVWGEDYLEDPANNYTWQPETVMWTDLIHGTECWALWRDATGASVTHGGVEYSLMSWSHNGCRVGIQSRMATIRRRSNNPAVGRINTDYRWVVNADGSGLKACEGFGRGAGSDNYGGFGWASTEDVYYAFGSTENGVENDGYSFILYKNTLDANNVVTGEAILDTSPINSRTKRFVKQIVNGDDTLMIAGTEAKLDLPTPNNIDCREIYFIEKVNGSWVVADRWGSARDCALYYNHTKEAESGYHDLFIRHGRDKILILHPGTNVWWTMDRTGSWGDGGPQWTDWDGSQFGEIGCEGTYGPHGEYPSTYFGHPCIDRWGQYMLCGTYQDESLYVDGGRDLIGTRVYDLDNHQFLPNYLALIADNGHHSWTSFSDWIVMNGRDGDEILEDKMGGCHYLGPPENRYPIIDYHRSEVEGGVSLPYINLPRPSSSPDGTKVAFQMWWLTSADGRVGYPCWCVHYYPFPPEITGATKEGANIRVAFKPTPYTDRPWPNDQGTIPEPREIEFWHLWVSTDKVNWSDATPDGIPFANRTYDYAQPNSSTYYYALTSHEYSDLESRRLGNIWRVVLDGGGAVTESVQDTAYPSSPGLVFPFYTSTPAAPTGVTVAAGVVSTHRQLSWIPSAAVNLRYHNVYYRADGQAVEADRKYLIASIPASVSEWIDWQVLDNGQDQWGITAVDRQGNESGIAIAS